MNVSEKYSTGYTDAGVGVPPGGEGPVSPAAESLPEGGIDARVGLAKASPEGLMLRIRSDDERALEELIRRFRPQVVAHAARVVDGPDAAEDVAQEVFVRVWERRASWRPAGSVAAYLFLTTRNLSLNRRRSEKSRRRRAARFDREKPRRNPTPGDHLELGESRKRVARAIRGLPPRRREVFVRARFQLTSYRDIASAMAISTQTVANHLSRATADLRQLLME